jgi:predicted nucleotidyltransferase component of viral defense system
MRFIHELPDVKDLFLVISKDKGILPTIVEKDYWIMHVLWGLQQQHFEFELKGGTSLSKGFGIINRFSEDIDLRIHPKPNDEVKTGKNHDKKAHIEGRKKFFDNLSCKISIQDLFFTRDENFDNQKYRSGGIRGHYTSHFPSITSLKDGLLLEVGFDQTTPYLERDISSWSFEKIKELNIEVVDNRAFNVKCYCPEYTLVEKLQAISTKYRQHREAGKIPANFLRHYYDVYQLLENDRIKDFIGTDEYYKHKDERFPQSDEKNLSINEAFTLSDPDIRKTYEREYVSKKDLYFNKQPLF